MAQPTDPLDILLPPSAELLLKTADFLKSSNIEHGELILQADVSQNVAVTDGHSVFVKVYRRKDGLEEPRNTTLAVAHGAEAPRLLASSSWCSAWEFLSLSPLPIDVLPQVMSSVRTVHERTKGKNLIEAMDYQVALGVILGRLTKVPEHPLTATVARLGANVCDELHRITLGEDLVFIHADLQLKNMGMSPRGPVVFDWEICKMAPVELELSKLEENLFTANLWTPTAVEELYGAPLKREILTLATKLRYVQNIAFHLERKEEGIAQRQYSALSRFTAVMAR